MIKGKIITSTSRGRWILVFTMINFILFCFRAEIKAFFYFIYILFSDVKISGQVAGKIIDHLSERYDCKNQDPPTTTCRGNYFAFNHAYFQLA
jgi:hypothetical protein